MEDHNIRAVLDRHWAASDANDFEVEHQVYGEDAVLEYRNRVSASAAGTTFRTRQTPDDCRRESGRKAGQFLFPGRRPADQSVDRKIEHGQVACAVLQLQLDPDRPHVARSQWRLRSGEFALEAA